MTPPNLSFMRFIFPFIIILSIISLHAQEFGISATTDKSGSVELVISAPTNGYVAPENLKLEVPAGHSVIVTKKSGIVPRGGYTDGVFLNGGRITYQVTPPAAPETLKVILQGCIDDMCFMPEEFSLTGNSSPNAKPVDSSTDIVSVLEKFDISGRLEGYHNPKDFINFITSDAPQSNNWLLSLFRRHGLWMVVFAIIPLGFLLNLTPCILPMIPITLGILGAGSNGNRRRGWLLGTAYGSAMAISYGLLGVFCVGVGGQFGSINNSWIFNAIIGIIFLFLAAAMMDWINLDFSRFRRTGDATSHRGSILAAFILGCMSSLLASACIAPVLVWVLLLSTQLYQDGNTFGLWLPMLLGIGLGAPWPFLGAGLARLPKPGAWMMHIKRFFAVIIVFASIYFLHSSWILAKSVNTTPATNGTTWRTDITTALHEAIQTKKSIVLDFWGVSCKACTMMDHTTLQNPDVVAQLTKLLAVKVRADSKEPSTAALLKKLHVIGMPTYIRLTPKP